MSCRCRRLAATAAAGLAVGLAATVLGACGATGITGGPLQASLSQAFARLYLQQQAELGNPVPSASELGASASCTKGTPQSPQSGAGNDWVCTIDYDVADLSTAVSAVYNVNVQTDGCYAADADGPSSVSTPVGQQQVGLETRTRVDVEHRQVINPLWLIDGCFDVS
jgi:ABC-2 type transport system permease protein